MGAGAGGVIGSGVLSMPMTQQALGAVKSKVGWGAADDIISLLIMPELIIPEDIMSGW